MKANCPRCGQNCSAVYIVSTDCDICRIIEKDDTELVEKLKLAVFEQPGDAPKIKACKADIRRYYGIGEEE